MSVTDTSGIMKKVVIGAISTAFLILSALGSYVMNASSKVEPLIVKTQSIEDKLDAERHYAQQARSDQQAWNQLFLNKVNQADGKLDTIIRADRERS